MPKEEYQFHPDLIEHLDQEPLIELHEKYTILVNTFENNQLIPTPEIVETQKALEARLISVGIDPLGYNFDSERLS